MTTITVYDPAMCCSTGICGTDVDQKLVDLAADLDWLQAQGVTVRRFGLSREPAEFAANATIRQIMQDSDGDDLPVFVVDGAVKAKARYPKRAELAEWAGLTDAQMREAIAVGRMVKEASAGNIQGLADRLIPETVQASACCSPASERPVGASGCCGGATTSAPAQEKAGSCC
jgi:hypothetical protein